MNLSTLRSLWQEVHSSGNVWIYESNGQLSDSGKQTGKFAVTFNEGGKIYTYAEKSVYKLAERFNLIPNQPNYYEESKRAIDSMNKGIPFLTTCGLTDTIRHMINPDKFIAIEYAESGLDIYDRQTWIYKSYKIFNSFSEYENSKKS